MIRSKNDNEDDGDDNQGGDDPAAFVIRDRRRVS